MMTVERIAQIAREDPELFQQPVELTASVLDWMSVNGQPLLALRHPENQGLSREMTIRVIELITQLLVDLQLLDAEDVARIAKDEGIQLNIDVALPVEAQVPLTLGLVCRKCGCTDDRACLGGCAWVEIGDDGFGTCSRCA